MSKDPLFAFVFLLWKFSGLKAENVTKTVFFYSFLQPKVIPQLTWIHHWHMDSPSTVLDLPLQSMQWFTGWALSQVNWLNVHVLSGLKKMNTIHTINIWFLGMTLAVLLYMGHIPRIFAKNLLYSQKTRFRVRKTDKAEKKKQWKVFFLKCKSWLTSAQL